jgi:STE24 endopeptidase
VSRLTIRRLLVVLALLAAAAVWAWAAHALWRSSVPASLHLPRLAPGHFFSAAFLRRSESYQRFLDIDSLFAEVTLLVVLALYAWRGDRFMRESAAGRIGTGMLLGMLGLGLAWLAELPFALAAVWWERRHGVSHEGYVASVVEGFFGLGGTFLFVSLALLITMAIAGVLKRWWWTLAAPVFVGLALLQTYVSPYLVPNTRPLRNPQLEADIRSLEQREGIRGARVVVEDVHRFTTEPNAESTGFGATRTVILWDTLLSGRFNRSQIRVVIGHELGHLAHKHALKRVGWLALFLIPAAAIIAFFTRKRGGLAQPEAVPVALFVLVVLELLTVPLFNVVSRRNEAEADWSALRATHEPAADRALKQQLAITSLSAPDPPTWSYVLDSDHPTTMQRIAMAYAWEALRRRAGSARATRSR